MPLLYATPAIRSIHMTLTTSMTPSASMFSSYRSSLNTYEPLRSVAVEMAINSSFSSPS